MTISTDKAAFFPGELVTITSPVDAPTLFISPVIMGSDRLRWKEVPYLIDNKGTFFAPNDPGMYAIGIEHNKTIDTEGFFQVVNTPGESVKKFGYYSLLAIAAGTLAVGGILYCIYKKFKK